MPESSLKSSDTRPSNSSPRSGDRCRRSAPRRRWVEALLVEARAREVGPLPVARRDVRSLHTNLELAAALDQRARNPESARRSPVCSAESSSSRARRLVEPTRTPSRPVHERLTGKSAECVPEVRRQRGGVEQHLQAAEEWPQRVAFERRDEHIVAARHVEVDRRRDLAQVRDRSIDQAGGTTASM